MADFDKFKDLKHFEVSYQPQDWLLMQKKLQRHQFLKKVKLFSGVAASVLFCAVAVWFWTKQEFPTQKITQEISTTAKLANTNRLWDSTQNFAQNLDKNTTLPNNHSEKKLDKKNTPIINHSGNIQLSEPKNIAKIIEKSPKKPKKQIFNAQKIQKNDKLQKNLAENNLDKKNTEQISTPNKIEDNFHNPFTDWAYLSQEIKDFVPLSLDSISPQIQVLPQMQPPTKPSWAFALSVASAKMLKHEQGQNHSLGMALEYIWNRKWRLHSSLELDYSNYIVDNTIKKLIEKQDTTLYMPSAFPNNFYQEAKEIRNDMLTLDWGMGLSYYFHKNFYIKSSLLHSFFIVGVQQSEKDKDKDDKGFPPHLVSKDFYEKRRVFRSQNYAFSGLTMAMGYEQNFKRVALRVEPFVKIYKYNLGEMPLSQAQNSAGVRFYLSFN